MKGDKIIVIKNVRVIKNIETNGKGGLAIWLKVDNNKLDTYEEVERED